MADLRLVTPPVPKLVHSTAVFSMLVVAMLAHFTSVLGPTTPMDMGSRFHSSLTPSGYVFGLWFFMYMRFLMLVVFELSNPVSVIGGGGAFVLHCLGTLAHITWLVGWAQQSAAVYIAGAVVQAAASIGVLVAVGARDPYDSLCSDECSESLRNHERATMFLVGTLPLNAWCAWSVFIAVLSAQVASYEAHSGVEHSSPLLVRSLVLLGAMGASAVHTVRGARSHIPAVCVYGWVVVGWFVRGFDSVAPLVHPVSVCAALVLLVPVVVSLLRHAIDARETHMSSSYVSSPAAPALATGSRVGIMSAALS
jgi:hypothetical protein